MEQRSHTRKRKGIITETVSVLLLAAIVGCGGGGGGENTPPTFLEGTQSALSVQAQVLPSALDDAEESKMKRVG